MAPVVILGLGNLLLTDDGVGVHAVRALNADPPAGAVVQEVGTAVFDALAFLEDADTVIAIDAVDAGRPPGTVVRFEVGGDEQAAAPPSLHDLDLPALLRSMPAARRPRVHVVGVQPALLAPGLELSAEVRDAMPTLLRAVRDLAGEFGRAKAV
jgi:hydrogenase maturation protease